jgi:hypothetical protein
MMEIPIYRAEAEIEGLAEKIQTNSSVAYYVPLLPMQQGERIHLKASLEDIAKASVGDLYPTKSILVSTVWNRNDDIFDPVETWAARHTPVNKPTNLEHKEYDIVGHMTETWAMDKDGNILSNSLSSDELPTIFHLCNGAVIYTHWEDDELKERTQKLISAIEAGNKYVSMECLFHNFDYGIMVASDAYEIRPRESSTAFLTKHLRAYGGTGTWDNKRIGRVLRGFSFSGKGYVNTPANPSSVCIFDNSKAGVVKYSFSSGQQENTMADESVLKDQLAELKNQLKEANAHNKDLEQQLADANIKDYETKIENLEGEVQATKASIETIEGERDALKAEVEEFKQKIEEVTKANEQLQVEVKKAEDEKVRSGRVSTLVEGGLSKEDAESKVEKFSNLDTEQFEVLASELIEAAKAKKAQEQEAASAENSEESNEESEEEEEANASEALENVEEEEEGAVASVDGSEDDKTAETERTRHAIARRLATSLGYKVPEEEGEE